MRNFAPDIARVVEASVVSAPGAGVVAVFSYSLADPYAVVATFSVGDVEVCWTFSRDLLRDGLSERSGLGDVCIEPGPAGFVWVSLSSPEGEALLSCERRSLAEFVDQIYSSVPSGGESDLLQVEGWIDELMAQR